MRWLVFFTVMILFLAIPLLVFATDGASGPSNTQMIIGGLLGFGGALVAGKVKKELPFNWGFGSPRQPNSNGKMHTNNAIPVTNPILVGCTAWGTTNDAKTTATAVAGSIVAWGANRLWKRIMR